MVQSLTQLAWMQQQAFDAATPASERRARGHFGTPPAIAAFMAGLLGQSTAGKTLRVLDPGAGVGILSVAVCEWLASRSSIKHSYFELWETDSRLAPVIRAMMDSCKESLRRHGHRMDYVIRIEDFILANARQTLFSDGPTPTFDLAILNPPYYKVRKDSPHAREMAHVVHGQPNIYSLFMAAAAQLLLPGGRFIAITPRSYFNGPYFKRFRLWFFQRMTVRRIHVFESRLDAFRHDGVLQENVILVAEKEVSPNEVVLTSSEGRDFADIKQCSMPYRQVIADAKGDHVVRVTTAADDHGLLEALDRLPERLHSLDYSISTGPVVTFRATEFLRDRRSADTAPLFWMHNVRPFMTRSLEKHGKPPHIVLSSASRRLLVPAKRYVLLKRFTAKEEKRRLVAGIIDPKDSYSNWVGLENHLNYIRGDRADLTKSEAWGLAAYLNSSIVDRYFRAVSGNTQVNAAEMRALPLPDKNAIVQIGIDMESAKDLTQAMIDSVVGRALRMRHGIVNGVDERER